jgi:hypothetical protein
MDPLPVADDLRWDMRASKMRTVPAASKMAHSVVAPHAICNKGGVSADDAVMNRKLGRNADCRKSHKHAKDGLVAANNMLL